MKTSHKIAITALAGTFLAAGIAPTLADKNAQGNGYNAEKRMGHGSYNGHGDRYGMKGGHGMKGEHGMRGGRGMKMAFERFDANKDGIITQEEVDAVIVTRFNTAAGDDSTITLEEFRTVWLEKSRDRMVRAFQRLDRDGDGNIAVQESDNAADRMFSRLDRDGNGELTRPAPADKKAAGERKGPGERSGKMAHQRGSGHHGKGGRGTAMLMERFDIDKDGKITRAEFDEVRTGVFGKADADGSNSVSLEEFVTVWQDMHSDRIVRSFQKLDSDGNLSVTAEEYGARTSDFVKDHDRNGDGVITKADRKGGKHHGMKKGRSMDKQGFGHGQKPDAEKSSIDRPAGSTDSGKKDI